MAAIYSARWVLPISSPPIPDGAVAIEGTTILAAGPRAQLLKDFPRATFEELGDAAILPGLVNTHSHLELTAMRGFLEKVETDFFAWLKKLTVARLAMTDDDLLISATAGVVEAARAGITCLGDSSSSARQSMRALSAAGLRGIAYQESFGPDSKLAADNVAKLGEQISEMRGLESDRVHAGISPHAPYTVSGTQLEMIARLAIEEKLPLMMHAAESRAEQLFLLEGRGAFAEGLKNRGIVWRAPGVSTIRYLKDCGILETRPLLAHCINVDEADLQLIKAAGAGIAHCPKSNAKLRHGRAPFTRFIEFQLKVGLGSDSVASNNTCDILEEARFATLLARVRDVSLTQKAEVGSEIYATDALFAATLGGARALGLDAQIGALEPGMQADLTAVSLGGAHQQPVSDPVDALIFSSSGRDVILTIVAGQTVYRDGSAINVPEQKILQSLAQVRHKLDSLT
jgi:cytosine/adenosine deaminase-related metal-dependent hydrolase